MNFKYLFSRKNNRRFLTVIVSVTIIYFIGYLLIGKAFVPDSFTEARRQSAVVAKEIVSATGKSIENLDKIALQDRKYNFYKALSLVHEELANTKNARIKAADLAKNLSDMAIAAAEITPTKARNLAIEAMSHETALITRLIVYNDILNSLLQTLEYKFSGDIRSDSEEVQVLIKNLNEEAKKINELNELFNQKMDKFDEVVGIK